MQTTIKGHENARLKYRFGVSKFSLRIHTFLQDIFSMVPFIQQDLCCDLKALKRVQIELSKDYLKQDDWYPRRNKFSDYFASKAIIEKEALDDNDEDQKNQIHKDANEAH